MGKKIRVHAIISGRVQGVFFRVETKRAADRIGVYGWVKNLREGSVEAVLEGDRDQVDALLDWCEEGPPHAQVSDVKLDWQDYTGEFTAFDITY